MGSTVRQHPLSLGVLSSLLFVFAAASLLLAVSVSEQVLLKLGPFERAWPLILVYVLKPVRALSALGALALALAFPGLFVVALVRGWSALRYLIAVFGTFVLLCLLLVLVATGALLVFY